MKTFQKYFSVKSIISGIVLTILGAWLFIILENKNVAYFLLLGSLGHFLIALIVYFRKKKVSFDN